MPSRLYTPPVIPVPLRRVADRLQANTLTTLSLGETNGDDPAGDTISLTAAKLLSVPLAASSALTHLSITTTLLSSSVLRHLLTAAAQTPNLRSLTIRGGLSVVEGRAVAEGLAAFCMSLPVDVVHTPRTSRGTPSSRKTSVRCPTSGLPSPAAAPPSLRWAEGGLAWQLGDDSARHGGDAPRRHGRPQAEQRPGVKDRRGSSDQHPSRRGRLLATLTPPLPPSSPGTQSTTGHAHPCDARRTRSHRAPVDLFLYPQYLDDTTARVLISGCRAGDRIISATVRLQAGPQPRPGDRSSRDGRHACTALNTQLLTLCARHRARIGEAAIAAWRPLAATPPMTPFFAIPTPQSETLPTPPLPRLDHSSATARQRRAERQLARAQIPAPSPLPSPKAQPHRRRAVAPQQPPVHGERASARGWCTHGDVPLPPSSGCGDRRLYAHPPPQRPVTAANEPARQQKQQQQQYLRRQFLAQANFNHKSQRDSPAPWRPVTPPSRRYSPPKWLRNNSNGLRGGTTQQKVTATRDRKGFTPGKNGIAQQRKPSERAPHQPLLTPPSSGRAPLHPVTASSATGRGGGSKTDARVPLQHHLPSRCFFSDDVVPWVRASNPTTPSPSPRPPRSSSREVHPCMRQRQETEINREAGYGSRTPDSASSSIPLTSPRLRGRRRMANRSDRTEELDVKNSCEGKREKTPSEGQPDDIPPYIHVPWPRTPRHRSPLSKLSPQANLDGPATAAKEASSETRPSHTPDFSPCPTASFPRVPSSGRGDTSPSDGRGEPVTAVGSAVASPCSRASLVGSQREEQLGVAGDGSRPPDYHCFVCQVGSPSGASVDRDRRRNARDDDDAAALLVDPSLHFARSAGAAQGYFKVHSPTDDRHRGCQRSRTGSAAADATTAEAPRSSPTIGVTLSEEEMTEDDVTTSLRLILETARPLSEESHASARCPSQSPPDSRLSDLNKELLRPLPPQRKQSFSMAEIISAATATAEELKHRAHPLLSTRPLSQCSTPLCEKKSSSPRESVADTIRHVSSSHRKRAGTPSRVPSMGGCVSGRSATNGCDSPYTSSSSSCTSTFSSKAVHANVGTTQRPRAHVKMAASAASQAPLQEYPSLEPTPRLHPNAASEAVSLIVEACATRVNHTPHAPYGSGAASTGTLRSPPVSPRLPRHHHRVHAEATSSHHSQAPQKETDAFYTVSARALRQLSDCVTALEKDVEVYRTRMDESSRRLRARVLEANTTFKEGTDSHLGCVRAAMEEVRRSARSSSDAAMC